LSNAIPLLYPSNTIDKPKFFGKVLYIEWAQIEQMMAKIKRFKCIALRCEKTATRLRLHHDHTG
jgi:uncharacterized protein YlbG (UPF0298 family)